MWVKYDRSADAAYIHLVGGDVEGGVTTYPCDPLDVDGMISFDADVGERLVGLEVMDASKKLAPKLLGAADPTSAELGPPSRRFRITHSVASDLAYLYLSDDPAPSVASTANCKNGTGDAHLDFNALGVLVGIEFTHANHQLPQELIEAAERLRS